MIAASWLAALREELSETLAPCLFKTTTFTIGIRVNGIQLFPSQEELGNQIVLKLVVIYYRYNWAKSREKQALHATDVWDQIEWGIAFALHKEHISVQLHTDVAQRESILTPWALKQFFHLENGSIWELCQTVHVDV